jgi:hypothetical protein
MTEAYCYLLLCLLPNKLLVPCHPTVQFCNQFDHGYVYNLCYDFFVTLIEHFAHLTEKIIYPLFHPLNYL